MQQNTQIFESIFKRDLSSSGTMEYLEKLAVDHPYFTPAQFFLLQQTATGTDAYDRQLLKTNILFNNPHWLHYRLQQRTAAPVSIFPQVERTESVIEKAEPVMETTAPPMEPVLEKVVPISETPLEEPDMDEPLTEEEIESGKEIEPMKIELKMPAERSIPSEAMLFEPMHMVDYFASQGIKLTEETQSGDKLGKQLKSFTEWLKTMKKVHPGNTTDLDIKPDDNIQAIAENSNTQEEVLTEAMAEVFAKQGKWAKSREVYQKLSLLNPHKSAYFAAKIENLKGN
jgi:hypothetical protein